MSAAYAAAGFVAYVTLNLKTKVVNIVYMVLGDLFPLHVSASIAHALLYIHAEGQNFAFISLVEMMPCALNMFVVAVVFGFLITVQSQSNCSSFLHIPLLETEGGRSGNCDNCTAESHPCPPWYKPTTDGHCVFGNNVNFVVENVPSTLQTKLQYLHCMTTSNA